LNLIFACPAKVPRDSCTAGKIPAATADAASAAVLVLLALLMLIMLLL